jgi:hypothetical protein
LLAVLALALAATVACGGGSSKPSINVLSPTPETKASPTPVATSAPSSLSSGFLYRTLGESADTVWLVKADFSQQAIATIPHASNYGSWPSLSPDGRYLAYTVFPQGAVDPRLDSQLWLLELASGQRQQLADHVQLSGGPIWSPDGLSLVVVRLQPTATQLVQVSLAGSAPKGESTVMSVPTSGLLGFLALGYASDGRSFYVLQIPAANPGSDVAAVNVADGSIRTLFRAGPSSVIDPTVSPDRTRVSWSGIGCNGVCIGDLATGAVRTLTSAALGPAPYFRPAWTSDSARLAIGHQPAGEGGAGPVVFSLGDGSGTPIAAPAAGFDAPMGWSADGRLLFVHSTTARTTQQPGETRIVAIDTVSGQRRDIAPTTSLVDVLSVGWLNLR